MIPQASPQHRIARYRERIKEKLSDVLASQSYILGQEVETFEASFASYLGASHCVTVNSGTDAVSLALRALGVRPGDEVITVSMTASGTAAAIVQCGATPVFVDVDRNTRCIRIDQISAALTARTVAIVPVHLHGFPVDMPAIMSVADRHGLAVVEDCAQAHGASVDGRKVGTYGHLGAFSFYPTKNLGCIGDGGAIATDDPALARKLKALREYGWAAERGTSTEMGFNSRLDEMQAGILNVLLPELDTANSERRAVAETYRTALNDLVAQGEIELVEAHHGNVYHQFAVAIERRDLVRRHLRDIANIQTGIHYPVPIHRQPAFQQYHRADLPVTEDLSEHFLSLPVQPEAVNGQMTDVIEGLRNAIQQCRK